jgi:hypothetical protein
MAREFCACREHGCPMEHGHRECGQEAGVKLRDALNGRVEDYCEVCAKDALAVGTFEIEEA